MFVAASWAAVQPHMGLPQDSILARSSWHRKQEETAAPPMAQMESRSPACSRAAEHLCNTACCHQAEETCAPGYDAVVGFLVSSGWNSTNITGRKKSSRSSKRRVAEVSSRAVACLLLEFSVVITAISIYSMSDEVKEE